MKAVVTTKITIEASCTQVFTYLSDLRYHYLWNPQVRKISTTERMTLGGQFTTESQVLGLKIKAKNVVTALEPPRKLVIENSLGTIKYVARFGLKEQAEATVVTLSITVQADNSIGFLTVPLLKQLALRELKTDLHALKVAVENKLQ